MIILGLNITHFGKLENKNVSLRPGMNIITGGNDSGKSTIAAFIRAMIYGLSEDDDAYGRYYPYDFKGNYGGRMKILSGGAMYTVERSFLRDDGYLTVTGADGTPVEDPEAWIRSAASEVSLSDYDASGFMSQAAVLRDMDRYSLSEEKEAEAIRETSVRNCLKKAKNRLLVEKAALENDLSGARMDARMESIDGEIEEAEEGLRRLREEYPVTEKELFDEKASYDADTELVQALNDERLSTLKNDMLAKKEELLKYIDLCEKEKKMTNIPGIILFVLAFLGGIGGCFFMSAMKVQNIFDFSEKNAIITTVIFGVSILLLILAVVLTVVHSVRLKKAKEHVAKEKELRDSMRESEEEYQDYVNHQEEREEKLENKDLRERRIRTLSDRLRDMSRRLSMKQETIDRLKAEKDELAADAEKRAETEKSIRAIELAVAGFESLGAVEEALETDALSDAATRYLGGIDSRRDDSITVKEGVITLHTGGNDVPLSELSMSTSGEVILSVRLALFDEKDPGKTLPLVLDDVFTAFDTERMNSAMSVLRSIGRQAVVLSCQSREKETTANN